MKRTTGSLLGLGLTVSMALLAGCTAAPATGVALTAIGPASGNDSRFGSTFRLGAGDALGTIIYAGGGVEDMDRPGRFDEASRYATVDTDDRPSR